MWKDLGAPRSPSPLSFRRPGILGSHTKGQCPEHNPQGPKTQPTAHLHLTLRHCTRNSDTSAARTLHCAPHGELHQPNALAATQAPSGSLTPLNIPFLQSWHSTQ